MKLGAASAIAGVAGALQILYISLDLLANYSLGINPRLCRGGTPAVKFFGMVKVTFAFVTSEDGGYIFVNAQFPSAGVPSIFLPVTMFARSDLIEPGWGDKRSDNPASDCKWSSFHLVAAAQKPEFDLQNEL